MLNINQQKDIDSDLYFKVTECTLKSTLAMFINIVVIVIAFYDISDKTFLFSWLLLVTIILAARSLDVYRYLKNKDPDTLYLHIKKFKIYSLMIALIVSAGIISLTLSELPFHQAFLAMIVAGLAAGAVMALSYYQTLVRLYLLVLIVPFASLMLIQGSRIHTLISFLMFLFVVMLILFSKKIYESMIELIKSKNEADIQAHYDMVTELANRLTLYDRLSVEIQKIKRHKTFAAILFIDLDDFKIINDTHGHHFGDAVLKEFATIISPMLRSEDTFARIGGDEFVILLSSLQGDKQKSIKTAHKIADKVQNAIKLPIKIHNTCITINASIGIDIIDENIYDCEYILKNADSAMYISKKSGKNRTTLFQ